MRTNSATIAATTARACAVFAAAALLLFLQGGCASRTYQRQADSIVSELRNAGWDRPTGAMKKARELAQESGETDRLLWQLEWGATARAAQDTAESIRAFDAALETVRELDAKASVSLSDEALAALNNMTSLTYRGTHYDRVLLSTYQALNYLHLGEFDKARVALNLTLQRQTEAIEDNAKRIEQNREDAQKRDAKIKKSGKQNQADINRTLNSPQFQGDMGAQYGETRAAQAYADYANPFATWLHGIFFLANANGFSDIERAHKSLQRAAQMVPENQAVQADYALAREARERGSVTFPPVTYIIFETGFAPVRKEIRISVPLFIVGASRVPLVTAAFPVLNYVRDFQTEIIAVPDGGTSVPTQRLADMDRIVTADFKEMLPEIITRTLINTLTKAAISYGVNTAADHAADKNSNAGALIFFTSRVSTALYSALTTAADLRTWHTLPREFQIARIPTPPTGIVRFHVGGGTTAQITLEKDATAHVIYVRSVSRNSTPIITRFALKR